MVHFSRRKNFIPPVFNLLIIQEPSEEVLFITTTLTDFIVDDNKPIKVNKTKKYNKLVKQFVYFAHYSHLNTLVPPVNNPSKLSYQGLLPQSHKCCRNEIFTIASLNCVSSNP